MDNTRRTLIKSILAGGVLAGGLPGSVLASGLPGMGPGKTEIEPDMTGERYGDEGKSFTCLFQGDSITDGNRSRNNDWNHVMGHGYAYLIASRLWYDHPAKGYHFFNRGVSGNKVSDLASRWQEDTVDIKPDLLSILVGVNDLNSFFNKGDASPVTAAVFESGYRALLQETKEKLPETRIVICEPFLLPVGKVKDDWTAWSTEMNVRQGVVRKLAGEAGAIYVPLQEAFDEACKRAPADYWIWDGIHPMPAGHELIARQWIHLVRTII